MKRQLMLMTTPTSLHAVEDRSKRIRRCVAFDDAKTLWVHFDDNISDKSDVWYTLEDYEKIRGEIRDLFVLRLSGETCETETSTFLGLEKHLMREVEKCLNNDNNNNKKNNSDDESARESHSGLSTTQPQRQPSSARTPIDSAA